MQSRVVAAATATKATRLFSGEALKCKELLPFWVRATTTNTFSISRTTDPAIHAEDPDGIEAEEAKKAAAAEEEQKQKKQQQYLEEENKSSSVPSKPTPIASPPSIKSTEVSKPADPFAQQRRTYCPATTVVGEATCVGFDGTPWPEDQQKGGRRSSEDEEDNRDYFKDHKASALSNIEMVDTRKPITKATDGTVTNLYYGYGGETMKFEIVIESAEETLMRAIRMWKEAAMRGDPDAPYSKALRAAIRARGEGITF